MTELGDQVCALTVDIFGTTVDWRTGVAEQVAEVAAERGVELDGGAVADAWRERYLPSMDRVRTGARPWAYLDTLHRESLDELLVRFGVAEAFDEASRERLVRAWHRLPAWRDVPEGLRRLRARYPVVALSNGGFALLTRMLKSEGLAFDAIISAQNARSYKPDPHVYRTATELLDLPLKRVLMVACHGWDIDGARSAGMRTAFVERPGEKGPHLPADRAAETVSDISAGDFVELAAALGC